MVSAPDPRLRSTLMIDADHPRVVAFAAQSAGAGGPRRQAVALYHAVRDGVLYDPYRIDPSVDGMRASTTLAAGRGWCVTKAVLLAACCRAVGIPARLGFADVRNHLSTPRMREAMRTDVFFWHGYTGILVEGSWVKATPAFNVELCERFHLRPLEFDGRADSIYHPFDLEGNQHMEYLRDHGWFDDVPIERMLETYAREYRGALERLARASFERDVLETVDAGG